MFNRLYLHIPFCLQKCSYCAFVSAPPEQDATDAYPLLLATEMKLAAEAYPGAGPLDSIYFGGGTPSLLAPQQIGMLLEQAGRVWQLSPGCEVTLEANPGTVDYDRLKALRRAGVTRLSLGVQSFDDRMLKVLGRIHDSRAAVDAFTDARRAGFDNIGIDLINSLPGQSIEQWHDALLRAVELEPEHLSVYGLTIEEGTPFAACYADDRLLPDEDLSAAMYERAEELLTTAGYLHYEIANYARPGRESSHNSGYWRRDGYLGVGVAAHSLIKEGGFGTRFSNPDNREEYSTAINAPRLAHQGQTHITREDAMAEFMFLGLRMAAGVSDECFRAAFGCGLRDIYATPLDELIRLELITQENGQIRLTRRGMLLSNSVLSRFLL